MENSNKQGKPIPFVIYQKNNFIVTDEAKEILRNPKFNKIGIISLVGKYRTGKSFLLNRVLLNQKNSKGFDVGPTIRPCTKGIWMWSEPVLIENNQHNEKFYSFFIDTEGLGAYDEEINHDSKIFLVAVLISSLFILNSFGNIDENSINSLSFIINLSKSIKLTENSNESKPDDLASFFPNLLWLLRDFSLKLEDIQGNSITAKKYLENALQLQKGNSEVIEEKNKVRKLITTYFKDRDCYSMVRPVENEKDLQNLQTLEDDLIRREFLDQAETLRTKVFKKIKPKIFNNKVLSGSMLVEILESIIESINKGAVPVIENSWRYMLHNESLKNMNNCLDKFKKAINEFKENNKENPNFFKDLKKFETDTINLLVKDFQKEAINFDSPEVEAFSNKLRLKIEEEFHKFNKDNSTLFENRMNDTLDKSLKKIIDTFETEKYTKNYFLLFRDLENLKEFTENSTPDFNNKKEIINEKIMNVVKKFIETTFLKNKLNNEKEIINLKNENQNLKNKLNLKEKDFEKIKEDLMINSEKLNQAYVDIKIKEKTFEDKFKQALNEKKNISLSGEEKFNSLKAEYQDKYDKLKNELKKSEAEIKNKDDHLMMIKHSEDKIKALNNQKLQLFEKDINDYKQKYENLKYENESLKSNIEELNERNNDLKIQVGEKKILENENERLKKENENINNIIIKNSNKKNISNLFSANNYYEINENGNYDDDIVESSPPPNLNMNNLDPNSDAYALMKLIKEILSEQDNENSRNLGDKFDGIKLMIEKLSKENEEYLQINKKLTENLSNFEKRYSKLEEKYNKIKEIKRIYAQVSAIQCTNCHRLIDNESFINSHYLNCNISKPMEITNISDKLKIKILKGVLNKDELGKPFIEYITEIYYDTLNWRVLKKFNQYANFHKSLKNIMGEEFKFPEAANIFIKISADSNNNFHENKIKQLEAYLRELCNIPIISNSKIFKKFFEFHLHVDENENINEDYYINYNNSNDKKGNFKNNRNNSSNSNFYKTFGSDNQSHSQSDDNNINNCKYNNSSDDLKDDIRNTRKYSKGRSLKNKDNNYNNIRNSQNFDNIYTNYNNNNRDSISNSGKKISRNEISNNDNYNHIISPKANNIDPYETFCNDKNQTEKYELISNSPLTSNSAYNLKFNLTNNNKNKFEL